MSISTWAFIGRVAYGAACGYCIGYWLDHAIKKVKQPHVIAKIKSRINKAKAAYNKEVNARFTAYVGKVWANDRQKEETAAAAESEAQDSTSEIIQAVREAGFLPAGTVLTCTDCGLPFKRCFTMCVEPTCIRRKSA